MMIGRIQDKNFSLPLNETASSQGIVPDEEKYIQDSEDRPVPKLGVANSQDGFEKVEQNDLLKTLGLGNKSVVDPLGYPGEEWLWQQ